MTIACHVENGTSGSLQRDEVGEKKNALRGRQGTRISTYARRFRLNKARRMRKSRPIKTSARSRRAQVKRKKGMRLAGGTDGPIKINRHGSKVAGSAAGIEPVAIPSRQDTWQVAFAADPSARPTGCQSKYRTTRRRDFAER